MTANLELDSSLGWNSQVEGGAVIWHPDGKYYITASTGPVVKLTEVKNARKQVFLEGHSGVVQCIAMSNSGSMLASGELGSTADVIVWDYASRSIKYRICEHTHGITSVSFSQDERFLVTLGDRVDRKLYIWDLKTGNIVARTPIEPTKFVRFGGRVKDPNGHPTTVYRFATSFGSQVQLWQFDPATGSVNKDLMREASHRREYTCITWSADFDTLYCGSTTGDVTVFEVYCGKVIGNIDVKSGSVLSLQYLGGGQGVSSFEKEHLYIGTSSGVIGIFTHDGQEWIDMQQQQLTGPVASISFAKGNRRFLASTLNGSIYDISTGSLSGACIANSHTEKVIAIRHIPASYNFATASFDGTIKVWDPKTLLVLSSAHFNSKPNCIDVAPSQNGALIISGWEDGCLRAVRASTGETEWEVPNAHEGGVTAINVGTNGAFCMTGGGQGDVRVWDLSSRMMVSHLKEHYMRVQEVVIYDDNLHAMSVSRDKSMLCWDLQSEKRIAAHTQRMGGLNSIALTKDQSQIITVGQEKRITFWDLRQLSALDSLESVNNSEMKAVRVSPDGKLIAAGAVDSTLSIWSVQQKRLLTYKQGFKSAITDLSFSLDGRQIVSVGENGNVHIWNIN